MSVCLSVTPCISETVRPRVMKFCVRNLHSLRMISIEKNFEKIEKKISKIFSDFFSLSKAEPEGDRREPKGAFFTIFIQSDLV